MPEYLSPGVYVEEVPSGIKPIEGVGTSTGAFIGIAERGVIGQPKLITNWTEFKNTFGGFISNGFLAYSVYQFFNEAGSKCYVIRAAVGTDTTLTKSSIVVDDLTIRANSEGIWGNGLTAKIADETQLPGQSSVRANYFKLTIEYTGDEVEVFDNITMLETEDDHILKRITSKWIEVLDGGDTRPTNGTYNLIGGLDGDAISTPQWAGADGFINAFDPVDDINILAIPDAKGDPTVTQNAYTYCQNRKDCFYVADTPMNLDVQGVAQFRLTTGNFNSSYAALYYPWIRVSDPLTGRTKLTPPSGAVVGTYSHTDVVRGVHKAPAGINVGYLNSATGVEFNINKGQHDTLNPIGVNVIRSFPGTGAVVWGARTLSADSEWKYVNVRRLFLFIEETIDEGTQWVVFEPNTPKLWGSVKRNLTAFLTGVWRGGALAGTSAAEAFFVKVDAENNPEEVVNAGQLIIEVGIAPVKPAEFVIIRVSQKTLSQTA
jgi:phage tail sheath protein FI